jgi:drug/metabolite transporter (DMT)-like permease
MPAAPTATFTPRNRALAAMFAAALLFSLMGAATKAATRGPDALAGGEIAFFRYAFGLVFLIGLRLAAGADIVGSDRRGLAWRGVFGGLASVLFFLGIQHTSLTNATLLNYTSIVWGPLLAVFSLGERLTQRAVGAVALAFAGVLLVTRPEVAGSVRAGDGIALLSGLLAGAAIVQIRRLRRGESSFAVFFYFNLFGLPISLGALWLAGERFVAPTPGAWPLLLAVGATSVAAQLLMTYGFREMTAAQVSLIILLSVVYSALLAHHLFGDALPLTTLVGGALILLAAVSLAVASPPRPAT